MHSEFGVRALARVAGLETAGRPYLGVIHIWDVHMPRRYPARFDSRRFGRDVYERALAGFDPWLGTLLSLVGDETLVVFTGDHGENTRLEPRTLRLLPMSYIPRSTQACGLGGFTSASTDASGSIASSPSPGPSPSPGRSEVRDCGAQAALRQRSSGPHPANQVAERFHQASRL